MKTEVQKLVEALDYIEEKAKLLELGQGLPLLLDVAQKRFMTAWPPQVTRRLVGVGRGEPCECTVCIARAALRAEDPGPGPYSWQKNSMVISVEHANWLLAVLNGAVLPENDMAILFRALGAPRE